MQEKKIHKIFKNLIIKKKRDISNFSRSYWWSQIVPYRQSIETQNLLRSHYSSTNQYDNKCLELINSNPEQLIEKLVIDMILEWHNEVEIVDVDPDIPINDPGSFFFEMISWIEHKYKQFYPKLQMLKSDQSQNKHLCEFIDSIDQYCSGKK